MKDSIKHDLAKIKQRMVVPVATLCEVGKRRSDDYQDREVSI